MQSRVPPNTQRCAPQALTVFAFVLLNPTFSDRFARSATRASSGTTAHPAPTVDALLDVPV